MAVHAALQCLRAARDVLIAAGTRAGRNVEIGRTSDVFEKDAIDILPGPDSPFSEFGADNSAFLDSIQRVYIDLHTRTAETPETTLNRAYELRAQSHAALLADVKLGLGSSGVLLSINYLGTEDFEADAAGNRLGSIRTVWDCHYRMSFTDPTS